MSEPTTSNPSTRPHDAARPPPMGLSLTQLGGGAAAAATSALLGSRLGVTGTIVGAALGSLISAIAGALYTASLARTRQVVVATRERFPSTMAVRSATALPDVADQPEGTTADVARLGDATDEDPEQTPSLWSRLSWKAVAVASVVVFAVGALVVTGVEAVTGTSLDGSGRTTFDNVVQDGKQPRGTAPKPSPTPAPPSSTPTPIGTPTPISTPSGSPSSTLTTTPSATPTPSPAPTDPATSTPTPSASP